MRTAGPGKHYLIRCYTSGRKVISNYEVTDSDGYDMWYNTTVNYIIVGIK